MAKEHERSRKLAVLIDAENTSPRIARKLFDEVAGLGEASVRRIYGDLSSPTLKGWVEVLPIHAIVPHQNFATTTGKNASDIALVIDAMDLLLTGRLDAFCIVSSDGDFTRLAYRIREQGVDVFGFGERKAPEGFRNACKRFIHTDGWSGAGSAAAPSLSGVPLPAASGSPLKEELGSAIPHIRSALDQMDDLNGWYPLGAVGNRLASLSPGFNSKAYGCAKLSTLVERTEAFEVRRKDLAVHIKPKRTTEAAATA